MVPATSLPEHESHRKETRALLTLMLCWFIINILQAGFLGLDGDEAYYWQLSQHLDWSYFDHPPMVALLIRLGEFFGHGPVFTRLGTVIISTLTVGVMYYTLPDSLKNIKWYILLCLATLILNVYSFITTPDAPLLFFASLFLLAYKKFLNKNTIAYCLLMAIAATGMFYSKYHGILLIGFVVLSNPRLLINKYFWLTVLVTTVLFLPHIYWQYLHDWPSIRFHLNERLAKHYELSYTTDYLLGQVLIYGPFISIMFYVTCYRLRIKDKLLRAYAFIFFGILLFFLLSSFKNTVEPHWTLIATPAYISLFMWLIMNGAAAYKIFFRRLAAANIAIIIVARVLFLLPHSPFLLIENYEPIFYGAAWAKTLHSKAGDTPVIFKNSYVLPSLYMYYNKNAKAIDYNIKNYRKTNFNLQDDCPFSGSRLWYYKGGKLKDTSLVYISTPYADGTLVPIKQYTCINALRITPVTPVPPVLKADTIYNIGIEIENKSGNAVTLYNPLAVDYAFFIAKYDFINSAETYKINADVIKPNEKKTLQIHLKTPVQTGPYKLLFSLKNGVFAGNFASAFYPIKVEE